MQVAQFMLLAAAAGYMNIAATIPDHLRTQASKAWRGAQLALPACLSCE